MDKGFAAYLLVFVLLIVLAVGFSSMDGITPTVAQAQAEMAVGTSTVQAVETGASWLLKLTLGAAVTGVAAAAFAEARKAYKTWQRNSKRKRWQAGPNAQWKHTPQVPKLTREDVMLLALSGRTPADGLRTSPRRGMIPRDGINRAREEEEDVELEMPL